jgi:galactose-1-phosphate uridylyltransferase
MSYNGWRNYETWRIHLEILGDIVFDEVTNKYELEDIVEDAVFNNTVQKDCLAADYARAFVRNVDFEEIARTINEDIEKQ